MNNYPIKNIQKSLFEILVIFDDFCKTNNIEYCLFWGNLLGVVRHKGFIPWDDDIDVIMTRENYDKFKELAHLLPNGFEFKNFGLDNSMPPKLIKSDSNVLTSDGINKLFIDIFPVEFIDKKQRDNFCYWNNLFSVWNRRREIRKHSQISYLLYRLFFFPLKIYQEKFAKSIIKQTIRNPKGKGDYIIYLRTNKYPDKVYPWKDIYPFKEGLFEGKMFPIPNNPDPILRIEYGDDYMTPIKTHIHILNEPKKNFWQRIKF